MLLAVLTLWAVVQPARPFNEERLLLDRRLETLRRILADALDQAFTRERKERMTPGQHVPLIPWATHIIQWPLQRVATR